MEKYSPTFTTPLDAFTWLDERGTDLEDFKRILGDPPVNKIHPVHGYSIMDCAALNGNLPVVRYLLAHGVGPDLLASQKGKRNSPLHNAIKGRSLEIMKFVHVLKFTYHKGIVCPRNDRFGLYATNQGKEQQIISF